MSATDELRCLLDEHGVAHSDHYLSTTWRDGHGILHLAGEPMADGSLVVDMLTPEQAVAATLGSENCTRCAEDMGRYADSLCDPLKERITELLRCLENDWNIRASWDGLRKFWCIELTEEGMRMRDAAHGTLTAEQVRKAAKSNSHKYKSPVDDSIWMKEYDWQAIADELNAALGKKG